MLLVTRPRDQALQWVAQLQSRGVPAAALPLLSIQATPDTQDMLQARARLAAGSLRALMFVSPNAVEAFMAGAAGGWPSNTLAVVPGPGSAEALIARGVPRACLLQPPAASAQFDSESLWPEMARLDWRGADVLVIRGEGGRDWLIERWQEAGARVQVVAAYRRSPPQPTPAESAFLQSALASPQSCTWLLSSSESLDHLLPMAAAQAPERDLGLWLRNSLALATHPRILQRAQALGFGQVDACRPDLDSVVDSYNQSHCDP